VWKGLEAYSVNFLLWFTNRSLVQAAEWGSEPNSVLKPWQARRSCPELGSDPHSATAPAKILAATNSNPEYSTPTASSVRWVSDIAWTWGFAKSRRRPGRSPSRGTFAESGTQCALRVKAGCTRTTIEYFYLTGMATKPHQGMKMDVIVSDRATFHESPINSGITAEGIHFTARHNASATQPPRPPPNWRAAQAR
jgi:hypothetical protein